MTTQQLRQQAPAAPHRGETEAPKKAGTARLSTAERNALFGALVVCAGILSVIFVAHNARYGAVDPRIANPAVQGAPRPVAPLFGWTHWIAFWQVWTIVMVVAFVVVGAVMWSRYPRHPILLMAIACTAIVWEDPIMNWAPYAVYNPQLWHWPESWPMVSLSPTVEPFVVLGYVAFYLAPFFGGIWILRRLQRRRALDSFVWRHPLVSLALLILAIGFVYDALQEIVLVRTQLYIYSQVIPFGSIFTGKSYQFPLLWESLLVTTIMIPAGVLLYRDDTGRTVAEKLAHRVRAFRRRPALGTFLVMFGILSACYLVLYGGSFAVIRGGGAATSVACPYPFPEAKVYDPQGYYAEAGQPGPYSPGIMDGWETGQSGRPDVPTNSSGRCSPTP
jgi:Spirocyclase AveC-like